MKNARVNCSHRTSKFFMKARTISLYYFVGLNITLFKNKIYSMLFYMSVYLHVYICTTCIPSAYVELCVPIEISLSWAYISFIMLNPTLCLV